MNTKIHIGITKKIADQLNIKKLENIDIYSPGLNMWHASLKYINRKKCIIFMNDLTRYSFFLYNIKKKDLLNIDKLFYNSLKENLIYENFSDIQIDKFFGNMDKLEFIKTNNRSINGSITQFFKEIEFYLPNNLKKYLEFEDQMNLRILNKSMNKTPLCCSKKGFYPIHRMKEELEM